MGVGKCDILMKEKWQSNLNGSYVYAAVLCRISPLNRWKSESGDIDKSGCFVFDERGEVAGVREECVCVRMECLERQETITEE